jgi:hypothetical protein
MIPEINIKNIIDISNKVFIPEIIFIFDDISNLFLTIFSKVIIYYLLFNTEEESYPNFAVFLLSIPNF